MKNRILLAFLIFVSFFFFNLTLQASFSREEQEALRDVNHSNIKAILEKYTRENADILNSSKGKDIVAFIGKTGSGKSTLINYLTDKQLKVSNTGAIVLNNPSDPTKMKIGVGFESETFLPKFINYQNLLFYDLPGIGDTRGTAISLINAFFIKSIVENARTARFVFVIGQDEITAERGKSFKELFAIIKTLIPNEIIENFSSLVITKSMLGRNNQQLINRLTEITEPGILTPWIQAERLSHMSAPMGDEINQSDKAKIIQIIQNTPSKEVNNINISVIYNNQERNEIKGIYVVEIEDNFNIIFNNNININLISSLDIGILENKRNYFQNNFFNELISFLDRSPVITLLRPLSENIYNSCWNEIRKNKQVEVQNILEKIEKEQEKQRRLHSFLKNSGQDDVRKDAYLQTDTQNKLDSKEDIAYEKGDLNSTSLEQQKNSLSEVDSQKILFLRELKLKMSQLGPYSSISKDKKSILKIDIAKLYFEQGKKSKDLNEKETLYLKAKEFFKSSCNDDNFYLEEIQQFLENRGLDE